MSATVTRSQRCPIDGKSCANPCCSPGYCFPESPARSAPAGEQEKPWYWWAGWEGEVECEGLYALGEFATRDEAITAGMAGLPDADGYMFFHIVEAQFADELAGGDDDPDDFQPFAAMRSKELIEHPDAPQPEPAS